VHQDPKQTLPTPVVAPHPHPQAPAPAHQNDLIDFGQNDGAPPAPQHPSIPADLHAAQTQNGGQQQKDLEETLRSTSASSNLDRNKGSLIDFHEDMKKELPEVNKLKRKDTDTQSLDEFVDAEG
jgi:hypothetical protein